MDTIYALATPPGKSGIAVIRISGERAEETFRHLGCIAPRPRMATLCALKYEGEVLDKALALWFPGLHSFTGEDVAELQVHGGRAVIQSILEVLSKIPGFRLAEPGEFSRRAFENGKMGLIEAEGLADLIDAETRLQQRQAMRQMEGELGEKYDRWRGIIISALSQLEAYIDFPDEDLPDSLSQEVRETVMTLRDEIASHLGDKRGMLLRRGLVAAILGAPNAGKSTLMNYLAQRDVAIVSATPGTTRDILEVQMDIAGYPLILCDTAGLRETEGEIEAEGIRRARARAQEADINIILFDGTEWPKLDPESVAMIDDRSMVIITKLDAATDLPLEPMIEGKLAQPISVKTGWGLDQLMDWFAQELDKRISLSHDPLFTRERHRASLAEAAQYLTAFLEGRERGQPIELSAEDLRMAARALGKIIGKIDLEEILDEIFKKFCIGK